MEVTLSKAREEVVGLKITFSRQIRNLMQETLRTLSEHQGGQLGAHIMEAQTPLQTHLLGQ
jgi:hypothetical protein